MASANPDELDPVFASLDEGATLVTASQRLARQLRQAFDRRQQAQGLGVWQSPDVLPWSAWLARLWQGLLDTAVAEGRRLPPILLTPAEEQVLWEQIIADSPQGDALLQVPATAEAAREAWRLLHAWALPWPAEPPASFGADTREFHAWARRFRERCDRADWLDGARAPDALAARARARELAPPPRVLLAGFDELSPQQQAVLAALAEAGGTVTVLPGRSAPGAAVRLACADASAEIAAAAHWARGCLERNPDARIGVVVPDLGERRHALMRIFDDVLQPGRVLPEAAAARPRPYNLSLGEPLAAYPVVHMALEILRLTEEPPPLARMGAVLRSPFLAGAETEMGPRARLDAGLREAGELTVSLSTLGRRARDGACPVLAEGLAAWRRALAALPRRQPPSRWGETFGRLLATLGWPGERGLASEEYQAVQAFRALLADLSPLDAVLPRVGLAEALARLRRLAGDTLFQPQTPEVPIQVLGVLEAAGLVFDHLWVMGLTAEAWPPSPRPNPFLPIALQRRHDLPHASAERELEFSRRVTVRLLAAAPEVVVSHPLRAGDQVLQPSPLVAAPPAAAAPPPAHPAYCDLVHVARVLEPRPDDRAPPLAAGAEAAGGTAVFTLQAACPFRAFAALRLGARGLAQPGLGLDPRDRGYLLHQALQSVWAEIQDQAGLLARAEAERQALVQRAVAQAIARLAPRRPHTLTPAFAALEQARLERLIRDWLELETRRAPFTVLSLEAKQGITLAGLTVQVKSDRIDRLADGGCVIIDYKTGQPAVAQWFGGRPDEPQLLLYAVTSAEPVAAVAFAQVRRGEIGFKGLAQAADLLPGVKVYSEDRRGREFASWGGLLAAWRQVLEGLAAGFRRGDARVDPKRYPQTCGHCDLTALCRVTELLERGVVTVSEEEGEDG